MMVRRGLKHGMMTAPPPGGTSAGGMAHGGHSMVHHSMAPHQGATLPFAQAGAVVLLTFAALGGVVLLTSAFVPIRF